MELNTFMERWTNRDGIKLIPALWGVDCVDDYAEELQGIKWLSQGSYDAAKYMVETLWPHIMSDLNHPMARILKRRQLGQLLVRYVRLNRTRPKGPIPVSLEQYAHTESMITSCQCTIM